MADVFLSYASLDVDRAGDVATRLQRAGYSVWWDRELMSGERFERTIQRELADATSVVVLWTPHSVGSEWVYSEARRGHQRGALVQVRSADVGIDDLPAPFDVLHCPTLDDTDALVRALTARSGQVTRPTAPPSAAVPAGPARERKTVTVLVTSVTAGADLDLEEAEVVVAATAPLLVAQAERFGGTVDQLSGGELVAVFGAPRAHEDDPERAVRAALAMHDAVASHGPDLTVRTGVATGEAMVSGSSTVAGDVSGTARRVQAMAPTGEVLVTQETYLATRRGLDYETEGELWRATGSRGSVGEALTDASTPMIGRDHELDQLKRSFDQVLRDSSVQLVTVVADPGMGKSRLVQAFREWLDDGSELVAWRQARIPPYGETLAYEALGQIVKAQAEILESDPAEVAEAKLTDAVHAVVAGTGLADQEDWLVARLAALVGLPAAEAAREELFTAWSRFLEALADHGPLVLVVEDLHWADAPMLDFLTFLLDRVVDVPLLLLGTTRPELFDRATDWGTGHRRSTTLSLTRLSGDETGELLTSLLDGQVLPPLLRAALLARAAGNPLYAREYVALLADQPETELDDSRAAELADALPDSVRAVVAARIDTLPTEARQLSQAASVVGHTVWTGPIAALTDRPADAAERELRELTRREFLRRSRTSRFAGESEYLFAHALIADVAYQQLSATDRMRFHERAADWHAARVADPSTDPDSAVVAHHYTRAHRAARLDPAAAARLSALAATWNGHASDVLLPVDPEAAIRHAQLAVSLTAEHTLEKADSLIRLGHAQLRNTDLAGRPPIEEGAAIAEKCGDPLRVAHAHVLLAHGVLSISQRPDEVAELNEAAIRVLEPLPPSEDLAQALLTRARVLEHSRRDSDALETVDRAIGVLDRAGGAPQLRVLALGSRGMARFFSGDAAGLDDLQAAARLAEQHALSSMQLRAQHELTYLYLYHGPVSELVTSARASLQLAEQLGRPQTYGQAANLAEALVLAGELDAAIELSERSYARYGDISDAARHVVWQYFVNTWIWALGLRGRLSEAQSVAARHGEPEAVGLGGDVYALLVEVEAGLEAPGTSAPRSADELIPVAEDPELRKQFDQSLTRVARLLARTGRLDLLELLIAENRLGVPFQDHSTLSARGTLAEARKEYADALELHRQAAAGWEEFGYLLEQAHSLLGAARCEVALGRTGGDDLARARHLLTAIGAVSVLAAAEDVLGHDGHGDVNG